jgi:large subunit ribosomal protein L9
MLVILREDLTGMGKRGDIVDVADGHARNYLFPKGLAMKASAGAVQQASKMRQARDQRDAAEREAARTVASSLVPQVIRVTAKAGAEGKLFGSVTPAEIAEAVLEQTGIEIDRKTISGEPIKQVGEHQMTVELHSDVSFPLQVEVLAAE